MKPAVIIVGADKGGVGKTTVTRTLLDYFSAHNILTRAFDTEAPRGTLKRFHPVMTEIVDMNAVSDQMRIIDTLNTAEVKLSVIDVRAGLLSTTLVAMRDMGFLDAVKEKQFTLGVFHILGASISSLDEIAETSGFVGDASYFLVKNHVNETSFFDWDPAIYKAYFKKIKDAVELTVPKLNEMAFEQVELAGVSFSSFAANKRANNDPATYSFVLRGYVRNWLGQVFAEYDRIGLINNLVGQARAA
jgi:hypothetical protein